jgi:ubiquinone/menaquinone biosynthesis C-methylase UbiE
VAKYLTKIDLTLDSDSLVLDAGSGTGIVTAGFYDAKLKPQKTIDLDLSFNSLQVSREEFIKDKKINADDIAPVQGNILDLPFADNTFDLVLSCGVLEYVSLDNGLREISRVIKKGGKLVLIPIKPSIVGSVLEILYKFKTHPTEEYQRFSQKYFNIIEDHKFSRIEPMGWSKMAFLLEKK